MALTAYLLRMQMARHSSQHVNNHEIDVTAKHARPGTLWNVTRLRVFELLPLRLIHSFTGTYEVS
jgi:hypothetical protein